MLQVIIVSGAGTPQDAARARAFCAFDYLPKPVDAGIWSPGRAALHVDYEAPNARRPPCDTFLARRTTRQEVR